MGGRDEWYNRAKQEGYRSRSAYKLAQLDDLESILETGATVVDLGAAPGGWLQVAAERVGATGLVVGVDRQRIDPLEGVDATVETLRCDLTEADATDRIAAAVDGPVDAVLSDMAPNVTGQYELDRARSLHLARQAAAVADALLGAGGHLAVKVFQGPAVETFRDDLEADYEYVRATTPAATRAESAELYLIAKNRLTAPVRPGDELRVTIEDVGSEGDGIARVEGFTVFVPGAAPDEEVTVRIEDVKPRFGFATVLEG